MLEIYVDADACPVKEEAIAVALRHDLMLHIVSNSGMRHSRGPKIRAVLVDGGFDAADHWIAEHIGAGDLAITADVILASRCVERGAEVVTPTGRRFGADNMGMALAMRNLTTDLRESGVLQSRNPPFGKQDRSRFLRVMEEVVQALKRKAAAGSFKPAS